MFIKNNKCNCCKKCNNMNLDNLADMLEDETCNEYPNLPSYDDNEECECGFENDVSVFPDNPTLAQSYVPIQSFEKTFKPCAGLNMGTIFPELVSPYKPCQSIEEIEFIKATNTIGKGCNS